MGCGGYAGKAFDQGGSWGVEELVGDAEDAALADGAEMMPVALRYDSFQWDTIACSAPCEEKDVRIGVGYGFGSGMGAGLAEESTAGNVYQFGDPLLGVDEGFAPLFAVDDGCLGSSQRALANHLDGRFHASNEGFAFAVGVDHGGDETDVFVYVVEIVGSEGEDGQTGFQDRGKRLHAVRDTGDDEIGIGA